MIFWTLSLICSACLFLHAAAMMMMMMNMMTVTATVMMTTANIAFRTEAAPCRTHQSIEIKSSQNFTKKCTTYNELKPKRAKAGRSVFV